MEEYNTKLTEENKSNKEDIENFKNQINLDISAKRHKHLLGHL